MTAAPIAALRVAPLAPAAEVPGSQWEPLVRRGAHLQGWFAAAEQAGARARHVAVSEGDAVRLLVPAYFVTRADHDLHDRWLGPLRDVARWLGAEWRPTLAIGAPFVQTSDPLGQPDTLRSLPDAAIEQVFDLLEQQSRRDGARAVVWPFLELESERMLRIGRARGYAEVYAGASAFLPVEWETFDDYLASRSKNVRRTIRGDLADFKDRELRIEVATDFRAHADAIDALFRAFFLRRNGHPSALPAGFFRDVAAPVVSGLSAQLSWQGDRLVGASLNLVAAGVADGTFAALAPEHEGGPVYYNDLLYTPLRAACGAGIRCLELGPTALYAKVLRGAKLRRRITLVRGTTRASHALLAAWGRRIAARTERKEQELLAPLGGLRCFT